eukprot:scaffold206339_cov29-Prasinocladus_malaysianus.AAC.1
MHTLYFVNGIHMVGPTTSRILNDGQSIHHFAESSFSTSTVRLIYREALLSWPRLIMYEDLDTADYVELPFSSMENENLWSKVLCCTFVSFLHT